MVILLTGMSLNSRPTSASDITLSLKNAPLCKILKAIQKQTGFSFLYTEEALVKSKNLTIRFSNVSLEQALKICFKDQPLTYTIVDEVVVIKEKKGRVVL